MSEYGECFFLKEDELSAVLTLGGMKKFFCFDQNEQGFDPEKHWNACCRLVAEGLMTQVDGQYRLRRDLFDAVYPIYKASAALLLTPGDQRKSQVIYYLGEQATALERALYGGYSLCVLKPEALVDALLERLDLRLYDGLIPVQDLQLPNTAQPDWSLQQLQQATFVLERMDVEKGQRVCWLRGVQDHFVPWLQWSSKDKIFQDTMTEVHLRKCLQMFTEGA